MQMIDSMMGEVARFHREITGQPMPDRPTQLSVERKRYALDHLHEEIGEFADAWEAGDLPGQVDALVDLIYVAMGRLLEMGFAPGACFEEVHRANMAKVPGSLAKRGNVPFDTVKPPGWTPPDVSRWLSITSEDLNFMARCKGRGGVVSGGAMHIGSVATDFPVDAAQVVGVTAPPAEQGDPSTNKKQVVGKPPLQLIPYEFEAMCSDTFGYGARKYSVHGYKQPEATETTTYGGLVGALKRHAGKFMAGEDLDVGPNGEGLDGFDRQYSGLTHIGAMGCCVAMLAWMYVNRPHEADDRLQPPSLNRHTVRRDLP